MIKKSSGNINKGLETHFVFRLSSEEKANSVNWLVFLLQLCLRIKYLMPDAIPTFKLFFRLQSLTQKQTALKWVQLFWTNKHHNKLLKLKLFFFFKQLLPRIFNVQTFSSYSFLLLEKRKRYTRDNESAFLSFRPSSEEKANIIIWLICAGKGLLRRGVAALPCFCWDSYEFLKVVKSV